MKRLIALLLLLALLLCGCTGTPGSTEVPGLQFPDSSSDTEAPPSQNPSEVPAPTQASTSISTTAGGVQVAANWSQYAPFSAPKAQYTRLRETWIADYTPAAGVTALYPFEAQPMFTSYAGGYGSLSDYQQGFCDQNGRIVADGTYINISPLGVYEDVMMMEDTEQTGLPLWRVSRVGNVHKESYTADGETYSYPMGEMFYGLVAMDGSFSTPCTYRAVNPLGMEYIECINSWDTPDVVVLDLKGRLVFTGSKLFPKDVDWWSLDYGEGLFLAQWGKDNSTTCWFADQTGKRVLGPYKSASTFHCGLAAVSADGSTYGYIDTAGNWVIPAVYDNQTDFADDRAIQQTPLGDYVLLDTKGRVLLAKSNADWMEKSGGCFLAQGRSGSTAVTEFYDRDGTLLRTENGHGWVGRAPGLFINTDGDETVFLDLEADKTITVPVSAYAVKGAALTDAGLERGWWLEEYNADKSYFVPRSLDRMITVEDSLYVYQRSFTLTDQMTNKVYTAVWDGKQWQIYDDADRYFASVQTSSIMIRNGLLRTLTDYACTYRDKDGNVLFCYPLRTAMDD